MPEIRIYKSKRKKVRVLGSSLFFIALGCIGLMLPNMRPLVTYGSFIFGGLGLSFSLYDIFDNGAVIVMNEAGIYCPRMNKETVNWELIIHAYLMDTNIGPMLCLSVNEKYEPSARKGKWAKKMAGLNHAFGFEELTLMLGDLN